MTPSTAARHEQEVVVLVARGHQRLADGDLVGKNPDGRRLAARDAQALARASGSRGRSNFTRTEEETMDQPDAVRSHNRDAWDAEVERGNRWTVPVDHQAIEAARRGRLEVLLTDSRTVPAIETGL
jgi:hypothetical protein